MVPGVVERVRIVDRGEKSQRTEQEPQQTNPRAEPPFARRTWGTGRSPPPDGGKLPSNLDSACSESEEACLVTRSETDLKQRLVTLVVTLKNRLLDSRFQLFLGFVSNSHEKFDPFDGLDCLSVRHASSPCSV